MHRFPPIHTALWYSSGYCSRTGRHTVTTTCRPVLLVEQFALVYGRRGYYASSAKTTTTTTTSAATATTSTSTAQRQRSAYEFYKHRRESDWWYRVFGRRRPKGNYHRANMSQSSLTERNVALAWYVTAIVIGALGASYAAVPLYQMFCQATGFGGTTQRVLRDPRDPSTTTTSYDETDHWWTSSWLQQTLRRLELIRRGVSGSGGIVTGSTRSGRVHTWTDEDAAERLSQLRPVENAELITVRFDTTVSDVMPWSFVPIQLDVKVVPGETALSFFRVTNHSDQAITGVATYNVHPPKIGLYFQKIQCFCFEEQRLLPHETVDMPVFFFIDPDILKDPQVSYVRSITLAYTFFQTDEDNEVDDNDEEQEEDNTSRQVLVAA